MECFSMRADCLQVLPNLQLDSACRPGTFTDFNCTDLQAMPGYADVKRSQVGPSARHIIAYGQLPRAAVESVEQCVRSCVLWMSGMTWHLVFCSALSPQVTVCSAMLYNAVQHNVCMQVSMYASVRV